jgi:hypothetical protein
MQACFCGIQLEKKGAPFPDCYYAQLVNKVKRNLLVGTAKERNSFPLFPKGLPTYNPSQL